MATHSSTHAWKIPQTEEPGRLQSMELQRVGHDWVASLSIEKIWSLQKTMHNPRMPQVYKNTPLYTQVPSQERDRQGRKRIWELSQNYIKLFKRQSISRASVLATWGEIHTGESCSGICVMRWHCLDILACDQWMRIVEQDIDQFRCWLVWPGALNISCILILYWKTMHWVHDPLERSINLRSILLREDSFEITTFGWEDDAESFEWEVVGVSALDQ